MRAFYGGVAGIALAVLQTVGAGSAFAESLTSVVGRAIEQSPEVKALQAGRRAVDQELEAAKGLGRPKLDGRAGYGYVWSDQKSGSGQSGFKGDTDRFQGGLTGTVPIFDGWRTTYEIHRQTRRVDSARSRVADAANSIGLQAIQAYLEVQRTAAVVKVVEHSVAAHRGILARVQQRVSGGRAPTADAQQATARLAASEATLADVRGRHRDSIALFISVVGTPPAGLASVQPPVHKLPKSVEQAVEIGKERAPSIVALLADAEAARSAISTARSEYLPKLSIDLGANVRRDSEEQFGRSADFSALIVLRQNFYNGGQDAARIKEAYERMAQAWETAHNAGRLIEKEIRLSWNAIQSARERRVALTKQVEQSRALLAAYTRQFDLGQRSLVELLDLNNEIATAETQLVTENHIGIFNVYRVLAGMGTLLEALGVAPPDEATAPPAPARHFPMP